MKILHLPFCALILLLLAGCAPIWSPDAMRFTETGPVPVGMAVLYIYRPHVETHSRAAPMVYLNDKKVVPLKDQGYTVVHVPPGSYVIRTEWTLFSQRSLDVMKWNPG